MSKTVTTVFTALFALAAAWAVLPADAQAGCDLSDPACQTQPK